MKAFTVYRPNVPVTHTADQKNAPDMPQYEGVIFSDGSVAVRWLTACKSTSIWSCWEDLEKVHGHPEYGTIVVWREVEEG